MKGDDEEEEVPGFRGWLKRQWVKAKAGIFRILPSAFRKLSKLEKRSKKSVEDAYRIVKETDILRLKMKINDFASAILGTGHGLLMFAEKTIYEDTLDFNKGKLTFYTTKVSLQSTAMRVVGMIVTGLLVFSIVKHYQYKFRMRMIENYEVYYPTIWKDPDMRVKFAIELVICSIIMPPFLNLVISGPVNGGSFAYTLDMIVSSLILLKAYTLFRVYEHISMWTNFTAKKLTLPYGLDTDYRFAFKSDVRSNNLPAYLLVAIIFVGYAGTLMFSFERFYYE